MIKINFDAKKIEREVEKMAERAYFDAIERARRSLGSDGNLITFNWQSPQRQGTKLTFGSMSFPSEELRQRFEAALKRELK